MYRDDICEGENSGRLPVAVGDEMDILEERTDIIEGLWSILSIF